VCQWCVKTERPLLVIRANRAYWPDVVRLGVLEKCQKACNATLSNCFEDDASIIQAGLRPCIGAVFDHHACYGALIDGWIDQNTTECRRYTGVDWCFWYDLLRSGDSHCLRLFIVYDQVCCTATSSICFFLLRSFQRSRIATAQAVPRFGGFSSASVGMKLSGGSPIIASILSSSTNGRRTAADSIDVAGRSKILSGFCSARSARGRADGLKSSIISAIVSRLCLWLKLGNCLLQTPEG
jgi:hypothetical protein